MTDTIRIATRKSPLALWQAEHVAAALQRHHPHLTVTLYPLSTEGDRILDKSLAKIGGKGLFIKELEVAIQDGRADIAVHSMKDVPWDMPEGMRIGAVLQRADPSDAIVAKDGKNSLSALPENAVVGTSSLRRQAQILAVRPDLEVKPVRGNVETRLRKLDEGEFDAVILAAAGLKRLGLGGRITGRLEMEECLPAVGQGVIGIECRSGDEDILEALYSIEHGATRRCVNAERGFAEELQASCESPIAAYGEVRDSEIFLRGVVATPDGGRILRGSARGSPTDGISLGKELATELKMEGADELLEAVRESS